MTNQNSSGTQDLSGIRKIVENFKSWGFSATPPVDIEPWDFEGKGSHIVNVLLRNPDEFAREHADGLRLRGWKIEPIFRYRTRDFGYEGGRKNLEGLGGATHGQNDALLYWGTTIYPKDGIISIPTDTPAYGQKTIEAQFSPDRSIGRAKDFFDFYRLQKILHAVPNSRFLQRFEPGDLEIRILNEDEATKVRPEEAVPQDHSYTFDEKGNITSGTIPPSKVLDKIQSDVKSAIDSNKDHGTILTASEARLTPLVKIHYSVSLVPDNVLMKDIPKLGPTKGGKVEWYLMRYTLLSQ